MLRQRFFPFLIFFFFIFFAVSTAQAGFCISPPYIQSDKLTQGTHYEQKVTLLRSEAKDELEAHIIIDAPEIESWISIDKGMTFDLPKGSLQVPMVVSVDVPDDASYDEYRGHINIRISPKKKGSSGVAIALGARVDISLLVTDLILPDFEVKKVKVADIEELKKPWIWQPFRWFFYRLKSTLNIKNIGNVDTAPTKVVADIYNTSKKKNLATLVDKSFEDIKPFESKELVADFPIPSTLGPGQYWARIKVYKGDNIIYTNEDIFTIYEQGGLPGGPLPLGLKPWIMLSVLILLVLATFGILIKIRSWRVIIWVFSMSLGKVLGFSKRKISSTLSSLKLKFWRWMHQKASKYQEPPDSKK